MLPLVAQIPPPPFDGFQLGPLDVRMYGILIAIGAYLALRMAVRRYASYGGDPEVAERVALWVLGAGFLGARIGYVVPRFLDNPSGTAFVDDPLAILAIWEGGLALFGGLFAGTIAGFLLLRRWEGDVPRFADAVAPAVPLAQAIGRWGNYFNQELYGTPTDVPWAVRIERADPRYPGVDTFHPTFLYESIGNLILVVVLLALERTGRLRRGALLWCYAIGYGLLRAVVESLRVDTDARYAGLSRNNWIALAVVVAGVAGLTWWQRRGRDEPDEGPTTDEDPTTDEGPATDEHPATDEDPTTTEDSAHHHEAGGEDAAHDGRDQQAVVTSASKPLVTDEDEDDRLFAADSPSGELAPDDDEADGPGG